VHATSFTLGFHQLFKSGHSAQNTRQSSEDVVEICQNENFFPSALFLHDVGCFMAKVVEFFIPTGFRKKATKWIPPGEYGKVIPFSLPQKKSA
jgi:hypothetical protein